MIGHDRTGLKMTRLKMTEHLWGRAEQYMPEGKRRGQKRRVILLLLWEYKVLGPQIPSCALFAL